MARSVRIKDHHAEQQLFEGRAIAAGAVMLLFFVVVIARLVWLQVIQHDYFAELSQGNRIKVEPLPRIGALFSTATDSHLPPMRRRISSN